MRGRDFMVYADRVTTELQVIKFIGKNCKKWQSKDNSRLVCSFTS